MAVRWIFSDIDGCLTPEASIAWDLDLFLEVAQRCRDASAGRGTLAPVSLCSGRPQPYVELLMKLLDVRIPAVCENGAVLYALGDNLPRFGPGVTASKILALRGLRAFLEAEVLPRYPGTVVQAGKEAQLTVYAERTEVFAELEAHVVRFVAQDGGLEVLFDATDYYFNVCLAGINKGSGLRAILDELGVRRDEVAGIGDAMGDLPLREAVGFFACPANAAPALKAVADYVSPYPNARGILDIFDRPEVQRPN